MASVIFNSCIHDVARGLVDFDTDAFKVMLVTSAYVPDKDLHTKRSDVTSEVVGTGYSSGGLASSVTVSNVTSVDQVTVAFSSVAWASSTITARGAVIYKSRGGAASADELVAYVDFGSNVSSTAASFTVTFSTPLTFQN